MYLFSLKTKLTITSKYFIIIVIIVNNPKNPNDKNNIVVVHPLTGAPIANITTVYIRTHSVAIIIIRDIVIENLYLIALILDLFTYKYTTAFSIFYYGSK